MSPAENSFGRIYDVLFDERRTWPRPSFPFSDGANISSPEIALRHKNGSSTAMAQAGCALERIQNRADIDISGPESNFVRSIRVFGVALVHQDESGPAGDEECERSARIYLGSYPIQACENADVLTNSNMPHRIYKYLPTGCIKQLRPDHTDTPQA